MYKEKGGGGGRDSKRQRGRGVGRDEPPYGTQAAEGTSGPVKHSHAPQQSQNTCSRPKGAPT